MASLNEITQPLGERRAAHLLRRSTFGPNISQIKTFSSYTPQQAIDQLLSDKETLPPAPPFDEATGESWVNPPLQNAAAGNNSEQSQLIDYYMSWHLDVMRQSDVTLKERLTWFYHTHLPVNRDVVQMSEALYYQNCLFRFYAYGSFKTLFKKICVDNAMLRYIDGYTNHKDDPNENFAREMFELYSIGRGDQLFPENYTNYTEDDIKAATRILTGWTLDEDYTNIDEDTGLPTARMRQVNSTVADKYLATGHDADQKKFSTIFDEQTIETMEVIDGYPTTDDAYRELDELIEMIFGKIETAQFLTRKLYRFFVYHIISDEIETNIIKPLAQHLYDNDYNMSETLKVLFKSEHFFDADSTSTADDKIGAIIKSPIEVTLGLLRFFNVSFSERESETAQFYADSAYLISKLKDMGLEFYLPFDVAGFEGYFQPPSFDRNWITNYALAYRYQIGEILMNRIDTDQAFGFRLDILDWVENSGFISDPSDADEISSTLITYLFAIELSADRTTYLKSSLNKDNWSTEWSNYKNSGNYLEVRELLEIFLSSIVQTPEFQII